MDIKKQIDYWRTSSDEDFAAAQCLFEKGHLRHSLFLAHLAVEKAIKANVVRQTKDIPPKIHNLTRLADMAKLSLNAEQANFIQTLGAYQLEGRYPDAEQVILMPEAVKKKLAITKEILQWLKAQL